MATLITAADILKERDEKRKAGILAHSANGYGEFTARLGCPCYTCRDCIDPTGEHDAATENAGSPPLPPSHPVSEEASNNLDDAIHSIKMLIEEYKAKQDAIYDAEAQRHDEMSAQDMEWEEYDTKIMSLQQVLDILENFA